MKSQIKSSLSSTTRYYAACEFLKLDPFILVPNDIVSEWLRGEIRRGHALKSRIVNRAVNRAANRAVNRAVNRATTGAVNRTVGQ
jgi:hypothetical protein